MSVPGRALLFFLPLLLILTAEASGITARVEKGVLDLRALEQGDAFSVRMNGEWEFYSGTFLYGSRSGPSDTLTPDCWAKVPGFWNNYTVDGHRLHRFGYGTYRAIVLLPSGYRDRMGFAMPVFDTSYELTINGVTLARNGTPARSKAASVPAYYPQFISYLPQSDTLEVLVRVSNWEHRRGGFWMPMKIGTFFLIQTNFTNQWFLSIAVAGILFAFFLFFFIVFLFDTRNLKLLMFALLTLSLALRPFLSAPYLITIINPKDWFWIIRGEYLILFIMITSGSWLANLIYPTRWFRRFSLAVDVLFVFGVAAVLLLPVHIFAWSVLVIQAVAVTALLYAFTMSLRGALKGNVTDMLYLTGFLAIGAGLVYDILLSNALEETRHQYILSFLMLIFVLIQATVLIHGWVQRGLERERLARELEELNRSLESRVDERTRELQERTDEINARNRQIARQNKKLSDTISLKNKIFSVISHDLRSPVVSILYSLHLLKEEESRENQITLADSGIEYAQQLISLIENMLVWGREQEDMIRYAPAENDLAEIILLNINILKESAGRKNVTVNFTQVGQTRGWFDRDLMDIVIRNLLSNAIKYTRHGGRVTIHLREKEEADEWVAIRVCDNGVGIPPDRLERLFKGDDIETTPGTDSEKGTGIGLRLVHELVTLSNGSITVESEVGLGSCFTVTLPRNDRARSIGLRASTGPAGR